MSPLPSSRAERLAALKAEVRALESAGGGGLRPCLPFGIESIDAQLGGGLPTGCLHEVAGTEPDLASDAAATLFIAGIAGRLGGQVLWTLARRDLFAPALQMAGLPPDRVLYAECGQDEDALAVMEEGLRHGGLGCVVGEVGRAGMTAARRLQLAAEETGTTALMLRRWKKSSGDPLAQPSAAVTRWRIAPAPSSPLPTEGIGRARWHVALVRQRGGEPFTWLMEASDAEGRLALPADARDGSAPAIRAERRAA